VRNFFRELRRRKVYTIAVAYVLVAWGTIQVADTLLPIYAAPDWVLKAFTTLLFLGFPVALLLAWVYDVTAKGVERTVSATDEGTATAIDLPSGPSIAVLPFENLSGSTQQDHFARALTADIVSGLTQSSSLFVLTADATAALGPALPDFRQLGKQLGVAFLLKGAVQNAGDTLRVNASLVDASNNVQIWSRSYERELNASNLFALQDDIREQIVATLSDFHGVIYATQGEKSLHRPTSSLSAYECLAVALEYDRFISEENHLLARESLEKAVQLDPEFHSAWSHLSWIYTDEYVHGFNPLPNPMQRALEAARKGVKLAPRDYHNHWLLSRVYYFMGKREQFQAETEKALSLNSSDGTTLGLIGTYTACAGDWQRGLQMLEKAKLLNPNFPAYYHLITATAHYVDGAYGAALDDLLKADLSSFPLYLYTLTACHAALGRNTDAAATVEELRQLLPDAAQATARITLERFYPFLPDLVDHICKALADAGLNE
jgi:adenylate cyclase